MATDEELMQAVATGDQRALATLCQRYERPLYQFLHRQTGGRDAEDLYQETWLRVVRAAGRFDATRRFTTWLFQIALNLCRDWRRRPPPEPVSDATLEAMVGHGNDMAAADARIDAARLVAALPEAQRDVVLLRYCRDLSEDQVAEILGCPRGTVKSRLHTALARLVELARATPAAQPAQVTR